MHELVELHACSDMLEERTDSLFREIEFGSGGSVRTKKHTDRQTASLCDNPQDHRLNNDIR